MACSKDELAERHKRLMQLLAKQNTAVDAGAKTGEGKAGDKDKDKVDSADRSTSEEHKAHN